MTSPIFVLLVFFLTSQVLAWEALPDIPSGRRSQFLVLRDDGAYKFGYDTGNGNAAKQEADSSNQVQGHYFYKNAAGNDIDLKYTSGVQGFQPEGLEKIQELIKSSAPSSAYIPSAQGYSSPSDGNSGAYTPDESGAYNADDSGEYSPDNSGDYKGDQEPGGDASYNFNFDTASYKRTESSDASGNIQGKYSFSNKEGIHDLEYIAGAGTGFVARSGSLSIPNGLGGRGGGYQKSGGYQEPSSYDDGSYKKDAAPKGPINPDGSYNFGFSTGDQSREESGDTSGNVLGRYSFKNSAGSHDLSYKAGSETGFLVTGGSLAKPNGLPSGAGPSSYSSPSSPSFRSASSGSEDGSYSFGFSTSDQDRQEDSDASGNVRGRFSFKNAAGTHDLSYVAGSSTGFLPTGGSLANPNGVKGGSSPSGSFDSFRSNSAPGTYAASSGPLPDTKASSYSLGNVKVHTYLPPSNEKHKFGYIFDTNY